MGFLKRISLILILSLILIIVTISGCTNNADSGNSSSYSTSSVNQATWHSVANFTGTGDKNYNHFTIKGNKFKLKYSIDKESTEYGLFYLFVYPEDESSEYISYASLEDRSKLIEQDQTFVNIGPGTYYCKIGAANLNNWKVEILDYY